MTSDPPTNGHKNPTRSVCGAPQMVRRIVGRFRSVLYRALRPFAHAMRPRLRRLAGHPVVRRAIVHALGRHSRIINTARLFLFGVNVTPTMTPPIESPATTPNSSLSAHGRQVLAELAETQAASRTIETQQCA